MKKVIFLFSLSFAMLFVLPSHTNAVECTTTGVCSVTKSDLELKDINEFKYQQYSYSEFEKDELMNFQILDEKNKSKLRQGKYLMVGHYFDSSVEYHAAVMEFSSKADALKLIEAYLGEYKEKKYKNASGTIYQIKGLNGTSVFWLYKNVVIQIFSTKDASKSEKFIEQAIDIYTQKFPPEKINSKSLKITEKEPMKDNFSKIEIISPKVGGSVLIGDKKANIKWTSDKKEFPLVDLWITDTQNIDNYQYIATNLKNKGKFSWKIPDNLNVGQYQLSIGIPGEDFVRSGISINVKKSLKLTKKELKDGIKKGTVKDYSGCYAIADQLSEIKDSQEIFKICEKLLSKKETTK